MNRFFTLASWSVAAALGFIAWSSGCGDAGVQSPTSNDAGPIRRDAAPVDPTEGGPPMDDAGGPTPNCQKYCYFVMTNCKGSEAQYDSASDCLKFCERLPPGEALGEDSAKDTATLACRQYWADAPSKTDPKKYCLAAGPFGGNTCGDRCTAFCDVLLATCAGDGGAPYASRDECRTSCTFFSYRDAGDDGGGETPSGPTTGDSFNCRLYWLRAATIDPTHCDALAPNSSACAD